MSDRAAVAIKSFIDGIPRLAHILFLAFFANDAIDEIIALAGHITSRSVFPFSVGTNYPASRVDKIAVFTVDVLTFVLVFTAWDFDMTFDLWKFSPNQNVP